MPIKDDLGTIGALKRMGSSGMTASGRWRSFVIWYRKRAGISLALALGVAVGIGCRFPTGWSLADNTASMFAALIGAFATAAAVVIGIDLQTVKEKGKEREHQENLRMRVKIMLQPMFVELGTAHKALADASKQKLTADFLVHDIESALDRLRSSVLIFDGLDNAGLVGLTYIETHAATVLVIARNCIVVAEANAQGRIITPTMDELRGMLAIRSNQLIDEVFEFSGGDPVDEWKLPV